MIVAGLGLVSGILSARLLGSEDRGLLAQIVFWPTILASFGLLSLPAAVAVLLARDGDGRSFVASAVVAALLSALATIALGGTAIWLVSGGTGASLLSLVFLCAFSPINAILSVLLASAYGAEKYSHYLPLRIVNPSAYVVGLLVCVAIGVGSVEVILFIQIAAAALALVAATIVSLRRMRRPMWLEISQLVTKGVAYHPAEVLALARREADKFVAILVLPAADLGIFVVAYMFLATPLKIVTELPSTLLLPVVSRARNPEAQRALVSLSLRIATAVVILLAVPAVFGVWICMKPLMGGEFEVTIVMTAALYFAVGTGLLRHNLGVVLQGLDDTRIRAISDVSFMLCLMAIVCVARPNSIEMVALGLGSANCAALFVSLALMKKKFGITPRSCVPDRRIYDDVKSLVRSTA